MADTEKWQDTITFAFGPVLSLVMAKCGLKTWLRYEFFICVILTAVMVIKPEQLFKSQITQPLDNNCYFLIALYGCYLIYVTLFQMFVSNKDESIYYGHFWARIVASVLIFIENVFTYAYGDGWNYKLLCFSAGNVMTDFIVNVYFLVQSKKPKSHNQFPDKVNHIAKVEFGMLLTAGLIMYAFPDQAMFFIKNPNGIHRSLTRVCGAMLFSLSFESFCLSEFLHLDDKKRFMLGRLVGSLLELAVILLGYYYYKVFDTYPALAIYLFINMSYNLLVVVGYFVTPNTRNKGDYKPADKK